MLSGLPVKVAGANIAVSQPKVVDICAVGEVNFFEGVSIFTSIETLIEEIKSGKTLLSNMPDFQILMALAEDYSDIKVRISALFDMIFPQYSYQFDAGCVQFRVDEHGPIVGQLNPMNFDNFKEILSELFLPSAGKGEERKLKPANDKAAEIARKLEEGRKKRSEIKKRDGKEGSESRSVFGQYISALSVGSAIDVNVLFNYTPFQLYDSYRRYTAKQAYDFYQKVASTPMMDVSKMKEPKHWMESVYSD